MFIMAFSSTFYLLMDEETVRFWTFPVTIRCWPQYGLCFIIKKKLKFKIIYGTHYSKEILAWAMKETKKGCLLSRKTDQLQHFAYPGLSNIKRLEDWLLLPRLGASPTLFTLPSLGLHQHFAFCPNSTFVPIVLVGGDRHISHKTYLHILVGRNGWRASYFTGTPRKIL